MTQPVVDTAPSSAAQETSAPQVPPTAPVALTPSQLAAQIKEAAGVDMKDLRKLMSFNWVGIDGVVLMWVWGKPVPVNSKYLVMAMFDAGDEVRAYAAPLEGGPFLCYVVRKAYPSYGVESMSLETFRNAVIDELESLEAELEVRDVGRLEGRQEAVEFLRELSAKGGVDASGKAMTLEDIAKALEDGVDVGDDAD